MKIQSVPFYNIDATEGGGGEVPNGTVISYADFNALPDAPQEEPTPTEPIPAEPVVTEPAAVAETVPVVAPVTPIPEPARDWRETVTNDELISTAKAKLDRKQVLSAYGVDEETQKLIDFIDAGGNRQEYLRIRGTDYANLAPEQLIEMDIKEKYPTIDNKTLQIVLKKELAKYNLDREDFPEDSDEAQLGKFLLAEDSNGIRAKYITKQESLKAPERQPDTSAQDREVLQKQITDTIRNSEPVKALVTNKYISVGAGDEAFNFPIDNVDNVMTAVLGAAANSGVPPNDTDLQGIIQTFAFHTNPKAYNDALIAHGKNLKAKQEAKEVRNVVPNTTTPTATAATKSVMQSLHTDGKLVTHAQLFGT
jgi:hypothetical protein